jgi:tripartite-type tricarboxylate transporter receptor subunit TctC
MSIFKQGLLTLLLAGCAAITQAQAPIKIIHGSNAGAPQDVMLRIVAEEMRKALDQAVIVEPRPGAEGQVAMTALKQAPADGQTIFSDGTGITSILQIPGALHKWTDFEPLYRLQLDPFALYVQRGKFADMNALIAEMRAKPSKVRIGGYAVNGPHRLTLVMVSKQFGGDFTWIPYNSGARAITDVMGGHMEGSMSNISIYEGFKEKTMVLAHTGETRVAQFPEVPTFKELGINVVRYHWRGMFVKKGTPEPVINRLFDGIGKAVKSERYQKYLRDTATLDGTMSRADYAKMLEEQAKSDTQMLEELGALK